MDEAWAAAEMAGIAEDIRRMPMGMHTMISEGSGGISGGQRQRIMIARAIAPKPKIIMLDEATSALDNITQKIVSDSLETLKCTRVVIAHRLSTIRECDRIIYLENGKILEDGTYDELIAQNGKFAELVERQRLDQ
jgi:ABC-type bacteriocin/lantibiotic exporter with double-glycine peptidase domain